MRKIILTPTELHKYLVIKAVVSKKKNNARAAVELGITERHVRRLIRDYTKLGKATFCHGNHNKHTRLKFNKKDTDNIVELYQSKYKGFNIQHFVEFLNNVENYDISYTSVYNLFSERNIVTPKTQKRTLRKVRKNLERKSQLSKRDEKVLEMVSAVDPIKAHPSRSRKKYFGELLQMDASPDNWFGNVISHLHLAVDDCTGRIVGGHFDTQETLNGYYQVFSQILSNCGIPIEILTDNRTVFESNKKAHSTTTSNTLTNFGYACQNLGVKLSTTSVPQAKGRVERLFETLQSRLINELHLLAIDNIEDANKYLQEFIKKYNTQFGLRIKDNMNVFEQQLSSKEIEMNLVRMDERIVTNGHSVKFENKEWSIFNDHEQVMLTPGTKVAVIQTYTDKYFISVSDKVYAIEVIPTHESHSQEIDYHVKTTLEPRNRKRVIPKPNHPWRLSNRKMFERDNKQLKFAIMHG